jgi:hypothetical protein
LAVRRSSDPVLRPSRIAERARRLCSVYCLCRPNSDCRLLVMGVAPEQLAISLGWHFSDIPTEAGGLISNGPDVIAQFRKAGGYVGRILKGGKPADLPVQAPTKYKLAINLRTVKNLGLTIPSLLPAHWQSQGGSSSAWPHQDRKYRQISRHRGGGCFGDSGTS